MTTEAAVSKHKRSKAWHQPTNWNTLRPFQPTKPMQIHSIDHSSSLPCLLQLIAQVEATSRFALHVDEHYRLRKQALLKIELIQIDHPTSVILMFQPVCSSTISINIFLLIQALWHTMFVPHKQFYTWNLHARDLSAYLHNLTLASKPMLDSLTIVPLQTPFRKWYNKTFPHAPPCPMFSIAANDSWHCLCSHRPYKSAEHQWTLHRAINCVFDEYIPRATAPPDLAESASLCLAITKLTTVIELDWSVEQLGRYKRFH